MTDDALILIGAAILLQLGLWFRVVLAVLRIEQRLDSLMADYWLEEYEEEEAFERNSDRNF